MLNEQLTSPTPFSRIDQPGLAWRTEEHEGGTKLTKSALFLINLRDLSGYGRNCARLLHMVAALLLQALRGKRKHPQGARNLHLGCGCVAPGFSADASSQLRDLQVVIPAALQGGNPVSSISRIVVLLESRSGVQTTGLIFNLEHHIPSGDDMKASMILLFTMVAVLMGSVTPAEAADLRAEGSKPSRIVHSADSGKQISIREGEILEIRLEQAGATGYSWEIIEMDERRLKVLSSELVPIREGIVLGGPVVMTWRLKALKKGRTELKASLYRSWEGLGKAARHFSLKIDIN